MIEQIIIGVFAAIGGGGLVKFYDSWAKKDSDNKSVETLFRDELRTDIENLRGYVGRLEKELRETKEESMLLAAKNAQLEYRAEVSEKLAKEYKDKADRNEMEVEILKEKIKKITNE